MSLKRGFDAVVSLKDGQTYKRIRTRGDVEYEESYTEIEVKNAASNDVRYIPGMRATTYQLVVQAGTDPEDPDSIDGHAALYALYQAGTSFVFKFVSPSGFEREALFVITHWTEKDPVDGIAEAAIDFKRSAGEEGEDFFPSQSSSSGNTTGH